MNDEKLKNINKKIKEFLKQGKHEEAIISILYLNSIKNKDADITSLLAVANACQMIKQGERDIKKIISESIKKSEFTYKKLSKRNYKIIKQALTETILNIFQREVFEEMN